MHLPADVRDTMNPIDHNQQELSSLKVMGKLRSRGSTFMGGGGGGLGRQTIWHMKTATSYPAKVFISSSYKEDYFRDSKVVKQQYMYRVTL